MTPRIEQGTMRRLTVSPVRSCLWKVAIDVTAMEESHDRYGLVFDEQPEPVITDPNAIIRSFTRQVLDVWHVMQGCALFDLF